MIFSSPIFLFLFLPLVLTIYFISIKPAKNIVLLIASLLFYAWGEPQYIFVMLLSIVINYFVALRLDRIRKNKKFALFILAAGIAINLLVLFYFKYAHFMVGIINAIISHLHINSFIFDEVHLPVGISFFTFHAISYLVDIYRKTYKPQKNLFNLALYISFFPQLIAGPIIRYHTIAAQLEKRKVTFELFVSGIKRFVIGLGKKVLIANTVAGVSDKIFAIPLNEITTGLIWLGIICYTIQIYFDFSGYSDMAIGLGRMFGFNIPENFNYPYISRSIQEFWRRWHISLSSWFRDYVYIPLGGNRVSEIRVYTNLLIVFLLCGLWHGANWHFVAWGLFYGIILALERWKLSGILSSLWKPLQHIYALLLVMIGWVLFRADNLNMAFFYIKSMFGLIAGGSGQKYYINLYLTNDVIVAITLGILFSIPLLKIVKNISPRTILKLPITKYASPIFELASLIAIFVSSIIFMATSTYNPFLYYRF